METWVAKLITLGVLVFLTLFFSSIPYFLVLRGSRSLVSVRFRDKVIACLNCFGGGVFLGTLLLHLLTEGAEEFNEYKEKSGLNTDFPLFNTFAAGGFFLVAFVELFMHSCLHEGEAAQDHEPLLRGERNRDRSSSNHSLGQYGALGNVYRDSDPQVVFSRHANKNSKDGPSLSEPQNVVVIRNEGGGATPAVMEGENSSEVGNDNFPEVITASSNEVDFVQPHNLLQAFLLLVALSFHTIFDGLAVGLQKDPGEVWQVFLAVSIHKTIIAFCLGMELYKAYLNQPWKAFAWLFFFSLMSPIGIGLGIYLTSGGVDELARLLASGILQGLAAGTFLYVTFLEILCMYIGHHARGNFFSVFFAMVGFCLMAGVKLLDHD